MPRRGRASARAQAAPEQEAPAPVPHEGEAAADPTMVEEQGDATMVESAQVEAEAAPPPAEAPAASGGALPSWIPAGPDPNTPPPVPFEAELDPTEFRTSHYLHVEDLFTAPRNPSEEERQRQAAADFAAAIAPAFAGREGGPVVANTPEEAVRQFEEATGPARPDPEGNVAGDIYTNEATAYYRIRRHFEKGIGRPAGPWRPPPGLVPGTIKEH